MTPYYASFIESALTISDDYKNGLVKDLAFFDDMCCSVAVKLSGRSDIKPMDIYSTDALPLVPAKAFGALITGITKK